MIVDENAIKETIERHKDLIKVHQNMIGPMFHFDNERYVLIQKYTAIIETLEWVLKLGNQ